MRSILGRDQFLEVAAQPCFQSGRVATCGIAAKKKDVCKTDDWTSANKVYCDSFNYEFLIHGGFIFVKFSKSDLNICDMITV